MTIKIGLALAMTDLATGESRTFAQVAEDARTAEALGFDSVWVSDHLLIDMGGVRRGSVECLTTLAALAAQTSRVQLGSLVLCNTFRHPGLLAKMAGNIQDISGGRLLLGLGAGWHQPEYDAYGLPFDHRVARLEESARALKALLDGGRYSHQGRYYTFDGAEVLPEPPARAPLWIAASGERIMRLTGELADGWNLAWFGGNVEPFARKVEQLKVATEAAGRPRDAVTVSAGIISLPLAAGADLGAELERHRPHLPQFREATVEQFQARVLAGEPEEIAAGLRRYVEAGAEHLIVSAAPAPLARLDPKGIENLAEAARVVRGQT